MIKKVILGISGGVDSAVAGLLLKKRGFNVVGVFMRNWDEKDEVGNCVADKEAEDAEWVCKKLDIPFRQVNFVKEYWTEVFSYFLEEYQKGRTPNPDIYCNRQIKFDHFLDYAIKKEEGDALATGHYARTSFGDFLEYFEHNKGLKLLKAKDFVKDQTFFLSQVPQAALKRVMFPLGNLSKEIVRKIASEEGLHRVAKKVDSRGICFIGKRNFANFISDYIVDKPGPFVDVDTNEVVGEHRGLHHWTLGQCAKLAGYASKYFTCHKNLEYNIIYVAKGTYHPSLFCSGLTVEPFHWIHERPSELEDSSSQLNCQFRFQHGKPLADCTVRSLTIDDKDTSLPTANYVISLSEPQRAITPGQFAVLYQGEECLGSAKIIASDQSLNTFSNLTSDITEQLKKCSSTV